MPNMSRVQHRVQYLYSPVTLDQQQTTLTSFHGAPKCSAVLAALHTVQPSIITLVRAGLMGLTRGQWTPDRLPR